MIAAAPQLARRPILKVPPLVETLTQVETLEQQAIQRRSHVVRPLRRKRKPTKPLHLEKQLGPKAAQTAKRQNLRPRHPKKTNPR
jgi:hypothetical protein